MPLLDSVKCWVIKYLIGGKRSARFSTNRLICLIIGASLVNNATIPLVPKNIIFKERYRALQSSLEADFLKTPDAVKALVQKRSDEVDSLLRDIWCGFEISNQLCLAAVGGYGMNIRHTICYITGCMTDLKPNIP
jgi:hypothetical protein